MADMYTIEGTISEIKAEGPNITFRITGTEGYAIKQKKDKEEIHKNVLCLGETLVTDNTKPRKAIIVSKDDDYSASTEYTSLLTSALTNGKRCRICFSVEKDFDSKDCKIASVTLLAE